MGPPNYCRQAPLRFAKLTAAQIHHPCRSLAYLVNRSTGSAEEWVAP